jgi:hypothetical protein
MLTLGIAAAAARAAEPPVEGAWGGRTSAALPVTFEVRGGQVENAHFTFVWGFCGGFESALPNVDPIDAEGGWTFLDTRGPRITATFAAPDRAEGTVEAPSRELPGCPKTEATFVARPGPVPPPPPILISDGRGHLLARPHRIAVASGPAYFGGLRWSAIGLNFASADSVAVFRRGRRTIRRPATISLLRPVTEGGHRTFRGLEYRLVGHLPPGTSRYGTTAPKVLGSA